jgi:hypothetical protein
MTLKQIFPLAGVIVLGLAACSDGVKVMSSESASTFTGAFYTQSQAAMGTNGVVVRNDPFPDGAVLQALRTRYQGNQYRFGLGTPTDWNGYTLVIGFGSAAIGNQNLCQNPGLPLLPAPAGQTAIIGDYCYGALLLTEAQGWTSAISDPNDPRLVNLVGDVAAELFAYRLQYGKRAPGVMSR